MQFSKYQNHSNKTQTPSNHSHKQARLQFWFRFMELRTADSITDNIQIFSLNPVQIFWFETEMSWKATRFDDFSMTQ